MKLPISVHLGIHRTVVEFLSFIKLSVASLGIVFPHKKISADAYYALMNDLLPNISASIYNSHCCRDVVSFLFLVILMGFKDGGKTR